MEKKHNPLFEKKQKITLSDFEIQDLVTRFLKGDNQAFLILKPYVHNIICGVIWIKKYKVDSILREDLIQECWLKFFKSLKFWELSKGKLYNYLFSCFNTCIYDFCNKQDNKKNSYGGLERYASLPAVKRYDIPDDLFLNLISRFRGFPETFIINYTISAIYFKTFNTYRVQIIKVLKDLSGLKYKKIKFLIDYSFIILRKNYLDDLEGERWEEFLR